MPVFHRILKKHWGYDQFRPLQHGIIRSVYGGRDTLALLPTGGGKSLCYQIPALASDGVALIVSPLIALMQDQVDRLTSLGIPAACLYAGMDADMVRETLTEVVRGNYKMLYVSPERLQTSLFREYLPDMPLSFIAVDEAHCISQWGHDFRPDYLKIGQIRAIFPRIPILAVTASATPEVREDICSQLRLRKPALFRQSFARDNLFYTVHYTEQKQQLLLREAASCAQSGLIYCRSRKLTGILARQMEAAGIPAFAYHAGMEPGTRKEIQEGWMKDKKRLIAATTAFGMGIDKADVRLVLHYDAPENLESWYQEAGRAGRDGLPAAAITLFHEADLTRLEESTAIQYPPVSYLKEVYQAVCNYLQIPAGSRPDRYYPFELTEFCSRFRLSPLQASSALRLLEREGLWTLSESVFQPARVQLLTDRHVLEQLYSRHPDVAYFCTGLLRRYGNIFHAPAAVRESDLAYSLRISREQVIGMLIKLRAMELISYQPALNGPQMYFHHLRVPAAHLSVDAARIGKLRQQHEARTQAMIAFLKNETECRNTLMLAYFGETASADCGHCDICLKKTRQTKGTDRVAIRRQIIKILSENRNINVQQLTSQFPEHTGETVYNLLRSLADEGFIHLGAGGALRLS